MREQTVSVEMELPIGATVYLYDDEGSITFKGTVEQFVPETMLLSFQNEEMQLAEFKERANEANGIEVVEDES